MGVSLLAVHSICINQGVSTSGTGLMWASSAEAEEIKLNKIIIKSNHEAKRNLLKNNASGFCTEHRFRISHNCHSLPGIL